MFQQHLDGKDPSSKSDSEDDDSESVRSHTKDEHTESNDSVVMVLTVASSISTKSSVK